MTMMVVPEPEVGAALAATDALLKVARGRLAKASTPLAIAARDAKVAAVLEDLTAAIAAHFAGLPERALPGVSKDAAFDWDPDDIDWDAEEALLREALEPWLVALGAAGYDEAMGTLGLELRLDVATTVPRWIRERLATAIKDISLATRSALQELVATAVERGYSIEHLVRGVPDDGFLGLRGLVESWSRTRATTIALTETATAWNMGAIEGYRASGLVDEVTVFDGIKDAGCAAANGATWTLDFALDHPTEHPRCQRAWAPVVAR